MLRNNFLESLALFDFADPSLVVGERATTTVPAQGLFLLNSPFVIRQAEAAADRAPGSDADVRLRLRADPAGLPARLRPAADGARSRRRPRRSSPRYGHGRPGRARPGAGRDRSQAAWAAFCQALFASAEFLYRS